MRIRGGIPSREDWQLFATTLWGLVQVEPAWGTFTQFFNIRSISGHPHLLFAIVSEPKSYYMNLCVNYKLFKQLRPGWRWAWMKHTLLHIPNGHTGALGARLVERFGTSVAHLAFDLVVNQCLYLGAAKDCPLKLYVPADFDLPNGLGSWEYAERLDRSNRNEGPLDQDYEDGDSVEMPEASNEYWQFVRDIVNSGSTDADRTEHMTRSVIQAVERQHKGFKSRGLYSVDAKDYLEDLRKGARISWIQKLRQRVGSHTSTHRIVSMRRPSRRHPDHFGRIRTKSLHVMFWIDTSASMGARELRCVNAEAKAIVDTGAKLTIGHCDARVHRVYEFKRGDVLNTFSGRGGTSYRPAFEYIDSMREKPDFVVYFTDGWGEAPDQTNHDVLWVLTNDGRSPEDFCENVCSWGETAVVDVKEDVKWLSDSM